MKSYSYQGQDLFAYYMNKGKVGYFLDIGCNPSRTKGTGSNSKLLELEGWYGLLFDIAHGDSTISRKHARRRLNKVIRIDCTTVEFRDLLIRYVPKNVDYISLDIDQGSVDCLKQIIFAEIKFKTMTIEHDFYRHGDSLRSKQRELLTKNGYRMLFEDVTLPKREGAPWEDWWINPAYFSENVYNNIGGKNLTWEECVERVKLYD